MRTALVMALVSGCAAAGAFAGINLEFRAVAPVWSVGDTVSVGLYAVGDVGGPTDSFSAAEVVFRWDPAYLDFTGLNAAGGAPLLLSSFPLAGSGGLNEVALPQDGDGYYRSYAQFLSPIVATTGGTLIRTFQFEALAPVTSTPIDILSSGGSPLVTTLVFDGTIPNFNVLGTIRGDSVQIIPSPGVMATVLAGVGLSASRRRRRLG